MRRRKEPLEPMPLDRRPVSRSPWIAYLAAAFVFAALLRLQWNGGIIPVEGGYDSELYLRLARSIAEGRWLGPYDVLTLIRPPVYPAFVAAVASHHLSLQHAQVLLNLGALLLLMPALLAAGLSPLRAFFGTVLCALHPATWMPCRFVATEALAQPLVTATMAAAIGMAASVERTGWAKWRWTLLFCLGLSGSFWVREEGVWLVPFCFALGVVMMVVRQEPDETSVGDFPCVQEMTNRGTFPPKPYTRLHRLGIVLCAVIPVLVCVLAVRAWITAQNEIHYGVRVTTELSEPEFQRAFRWLTRLDAERHHPWVPMTRRAMIEAERVSPKFAKLMPFLSGQFDGAGWSQFGCAWMGICEEIAGGWMVWAFREAAAAAGNHADAVSARAFYGEMADEIEGACASGLVRCSANPSGSVLAPPIQAVDVGRILVSCARVLWMAIWMPDLGEGIAALEQFPTDSTRGQAYAWLKADRIGGKGGPFDRFGPQIVWAYRGVHLAAVGWVVVWWSREAVRWFCRRGRRTGGLTVLGAACLLLGVIIVSRTLLVAYIDAMSFRAQLRYMLAVYPALIAMACCCRNKPLQRYALSQRL